MRALGTLSLCSRHVPEGVCAGARACSLQLENPICLPLDCSHVFFASSWPAGESREVVKFEGEVSTEAVNTFILGEKLPLTIEFTQDNSDKIFNSGVKKQILLWGKVRHRDQQAPRAQCIWLPAYGCRSRPWA